MTREALFAEALQLLAAVERARRFLGFPVNVDDEAPEDEALYMRQMDKRNTAETVRQGRQALIALDYKDIAERCVTFYRQAVIVRDDIAHSAYIEVQEDEPDVLRLNRPDGLMNPSVVTYSLDELQCHRQRAAWIVEAVVYALHDSGRATGWLSAGGGRSRYVPRLPPTPSCD